MNFAIEVVRVEDIMPEQQAELDKLNQECFGDVEDVEIQENFIAEPFAYLFAFVGKAIISRLALYKREIMFSKQKMLIGGIGGVCVTSAHRHHGVASSMLKRALLILKEEKCDLACLNVDLDKKIYGIYEKLGFKMMDRDISFENVRGEIIHDPGSMFMALESPEKYTIVMESTQTFHYGRGYW